MLRSEVDAAAMNSMMGDVIDALEWDYGTGALSDESRRLLHELLEADKEGE